MIRHMFVFGVILPTLVTIFLFVAFLVCWFKFNMHERLFSKRKLFSKQIKNVMAPRQSANSKQSHIYTTDNSVPARPGGKDRGAGAGAATTNSKASNSGAGGSTGGILSRTIKRYENCVSGSKRSSSQDDDVHEHSVGDDPEAALCGACEDEEVHRAAMAGFTNPNLCASPTHSTAADDEDEEDDDDVVMDEDDARCRQQQQHGALPAGCSSIRGPAATAGFRPQQAACSELQVQTQPDDTQHHTDTDVEDADVEYVQVKQIGSMFQHTFHFPASECSNLSNSLVPGDSEDGGSDIDGGNTGNNYGHFVPLSQLLRDPKARHQFYSVAHSRADSPASGGEFCDNTAGDGQNAGVNCSETGRLITGM